MCDRHRSCPDSAALDGPVSIPLARSRNTPCTRYLGGCGHARPRLCPLGTRAQFLVNKNAFNFRETCSRHYYHILPSYQYHPLPTIHLHIGAISPPTPHFASPPKSAPRHSQFPRLMCNHTDRATVSGPSPQPAGAARFPPPNPPIEDDHGSLPGNGPLETPV
jgi:hypothetical protein